MGWVVVFFGGLLMALFVIFMAIGYGLAWPLIHKKVPVYGRIVAGVGSAVAAFLGLAWADLDVFGIVAGIFTVMAFPNFLRPEIGGEAAFLDTARDASAIDHSVFGFGILYVGV